MNWLEKIIVIKLKLSIQLDTLNRQGLEYSGDTYAVCLNTRNFCIPDFLVSGFTNCNHSINISDAISNT